MKKPSDDLFKLIKALSASEKRYFKVITAQRDGEKSANYHRLFDAIDEQDDYDEAAMMENYRGEKFLKNLSMSKKYLMESVVKALCSYHASEGRILEIHEKSRAAYVLKEKGLKELSDKLLKNAGIKAEKYEHFTHLLMIKRKEMLNTIGSTEEGLEVRLEREREQQLKIVEILRLETEFAWLLCLSHAKIARAAYSRSEEDRKALQELLEHPLLRDESHLDSYTLLYTYHNIKSRLYYILGDYENSYEHCRKNLEVADIALHKREESPTNYLQLLHNFAVRCLKVGREEELDNTIQRIRNLPATDVRMRKLKFESVYQLSINYNVMTFQHEKILELLPAIEGEYEELKGKLERRQVVATFYSAMLSLLYIGRFRDALTWSEKVIALENSVTDLYCFVKIIMVVLHYELGDHDALENQIRSTRRHLKKRMRFFRLEQVFLRELAKAGGIAGRAEQLDFYRALLDTLKEIVREPGEARAIEYFDCISWVDSKIHGTSVAEIHRRNGHYKPDGA